MCASGVRMFFIHIPTKSYTSHVQGETEKEIICEACGEEYSYTLCRNATGTDSAVFLFSRAERRALEKAQASLQHKLDTEHDDVPCPACGQHQAVMIAQVRKRSYSGLKNLGGGFLILASLAMGIMLLMLAISVWVQKQPLPSKSVVEGCAIGVGAFAIPGLILRGIRTLLLFNYNPNISTPAS